MAYTQIPEPGEPIQLREFFLEDRRFPAVYFLYHHGEVVYVGQTRTLQFRIGQHLDARAKAFDAVGFIRCQLGDLLRFESHYIRQLAPKHNACGLSKKMRARESWALEENRELARRPDAFDYHVEASANCGITGDDGQVYIRPKEVGKFLMVSDQDAAKWFDPNQSCNIPMMLLLYWVASNHRELSKAQQRFEQL